MLRSITLLLAVFSAPLASAQLSAPFPVPDGLAPAPPSGEQRNVAVAAGGGSYLAVWEDDRHTLGGQLGHGSLTPHGDLLAMRYDVNGIQLHAAPIVVSNATFEQLAPRVAWNGTDWLVVFTSRRWVGAFSTTGVYAVRVAGNGDVLDSQPILVDDNNQVDELDPDVTSDGTNWIVTWYDEVPSSGNRLRKLRRIAPDGMQLNTQVLVNTPTNDFPFRGRLAFGGGQVLFVAENGAAVKAWIVDPVTLQASSEVTLTTDGNRPVAVTDGTDFFVAWQKDEVFDKFLGTLVTAAGTVAVPGGTQVAAMQTSAGDNQVAVAFDGTGYWLAIDQQGFSGGEWLEAYRVDPAGQPTAAPPTVVSSSPTPSGGVLATGATPGAVLAVWQDTTTGFADLEGAFLTGGGVIAIGPMELTAANHVDSDVAGTAQDGYLLVTLARQSGTNRVLGLRLDGKGSPITGVPFLVHSGFETVNTPRVAWNGSHWLVVWENWNSLGGEESGAVISFRRVAPDESLPDPAPTPVLNGNWPDVEALGDDFLIAGSMRTSLDIRRVWSVRVTGNGISTGTAELLGDNFARYPRIAALEDKWVVAWQHKDTHDSASGPARFRFVDAAGQPAAAVFTGASTAERPDLSVMNGTITVVASNGDDVFARTFDAAGTQLGAALTLANAALDQFAPRVGNDGTRFLASWIDYGVHVTNSEGLGDVLGARYTDGPAGPAPTGAQFEMANDSRVPEATSAVAGDEGVTLALTQEFDRDDAGWRTVLRVLDEALVCQVDLGFAGPGTSLLSMCGTGLGVGQTSELELGGAAPSVTGVLVFGFSNVPVPLFAGTLVPSDAAVLLWFTTSVTGNFSLPGIVGGQPLHPTLYAQSITFDPGLPEIASFSNALQLQF